MEKFLIGFFAFVSLFAIGYLYGHDFGYEDGKAYQRFADNNQLQSCNKVVARNKGEPEGI